MTADPSLTALGDIGWLASTLGSDASSGAGVLPGSIRRLGTGPTVAGYACTATIGTDDNLYMPRAIERGPVSGRILIAGGGWLSRSSALGGVTGLQMLVNGFEAFITDGLIRDSAELSRMPLAVWSRGVTPRASSKLGPGSMGLGTSCGGVAVEEGDFIIADDDGVVVWPRAEVAAMLQRARERMVADDARALELKRQLSQ